MARKIHHDQAGRRFWAETADGSEAHLAYEQPDDETLDLVSTFVPKEARGEGLASDIVQYAFDHARHHDLQVVATCPYVQDWLEKHPDYQAVAVRPRR
ncbi:MAG TPA: GNAT family N-acetyltransferase [Thermoanaerobaculia bacterium]|nr:GNAT family N-acetyltransferase [Thermoanaerobaculia bacterium]